MYTSKFHQKTTSKKLCSGKTISQSRLCKQKTQPASIPIVQIGAYRNTRSKFTEYIVPDEKIVFEATGYNVMLKKKEALQSSISWKMLRPIRTKLKKWQQHIFLCFSNKKLKSKSVSEILSRYKLEQDFTIYWDHPKNKYA